MDKTSYLYILGNYRPTLYIGVTTDLEDRLKWHRAYGQKDSFVRKYGLTKLLYFETYGTLEEAIRREKQLKGWRRDWKLGLIRKVNPEMVDLRGGGALDPETSSG